MPALVWASTLMFMALLIVYSVAVPLTEAADEPSHIDLVAHLAEGAPYPSYDGRLLSLPVTKLCSTNVASSRECRTLDQTVTKGIQEHARLSALPRSTRPTFEQLGGDQPTSSPNALPQHPPLYYQAMAVVLRAERGITHHRWPFDREVAFLRLANVLLVMWLPLLCWLTARWLGYDQRVGSVASLIPLTIPQLVHIGSVVNNDNLLILLGAIAVALLARVVRGDRTPRTAAVLGLVVGLAIMTKVIAIVLPLAIIAAYVASASPRDWREATDEPRWRTVGVPLVISGVVTAVVSLWWFVSNLSRTGSLTPTIEDQRLTTASRPPGFHASPVTFAKTFLSLFWERFWGWFGWFTVRISLGSIIAGSIVLMALLVLGFVTVPTDTRRRELAVVAAPCGLFALFVIQHAWVLHVRTGEYPFIQGRYVYGAFTGVLVIAAAGATRVLGRGAAVPLAIAAVATQIDALRRILAAYWNGTGLGVREQIKAMMAWSPWSGATFLIIAVLTFAAFAGLLVAVVWFLAGGSGGRRRPVRVPQAPRASAQ